MAARPTLTVLLKRLRKLVGDPDSAVWEDEELQEFLDSEHQVVHRYLPLRIEATRTPGGFTYNNFYSDDFGNWEADAILTDASYTDITGSATLSDLIVGHWAFTAQPNIPVYATGKTYDLFGCAADLLEAQAGTLRLKFDVQDASGAKMALSQQVKATMNLAAAYRAKQRARSAPSTRTDSGQGTQSGPASWAGRGGWINTGIAD